MDEISTAKPRSKPQFTAWHLLILAGLIAFAITAGVIVWFISRATNPVMSESITNEFREYVPTVGSADGILETATSSVPETFTQRDSAWLFNIIPLGTTVSEIRVPAVYRYHIRLYDPWKLIAAGQVCLVLAPQFNPSLPPAIITGQMEKSTSNGWLRFNGEDDLSKLEHGITKELNKRANDTVHRDFVREACRRSVADFVRTWLMKQDSWREDRFHQIVVAFPDELPGNTNGPNANLARYTVSFESSTSR